MREILQTIVEKRFSPINWIILSQNTSIGSHVTIADYIEVLEHLFALHVLYQVRTLGSSHISFRKRRKVYISDPLLYFTFSGWTSGTARYWQHAMNVVSDPYRRGLLVENLVAAHLFRSVPALRFWHNSSEIDFIVVNEGAPPLYIESKYQGAITSADTKPLRMAGGGLVLSKDTLREDPEHHVVVVPTALFLAMLGC